MGSYKWGYKKGITIVITHIRGLISPLITTHEPPSREGASVLQEFLFYLGIQKPTASGVIPSDKGVIASVGVTGRF